MPDAPHARYAAAIAAGNAISLFGRDEAEKVRAAWELLIPAADRVGLVFHVRRDNLSEKLFMWVSGE